MGYTAGNRRQHRRRRLGPLGDQNGRAIAIDGAENL